MQKRLFIQLGILNGVLLLLLLFFLSLNRTDLIIALGLSTTNFILTARWIVLGAAFVLGNGFILVSYFRKRPKLPPPVQTPLLTFDPGQQQNPDNIRTELIRYQTERPALQPQLAQGIDQLDSIDRKQAKLKEIFERNAVESLGDVGATIDDTEQSICKNLAKVLNRAILWDPLEWNKPGKEAIYKDHRVYIQRCLDRNEEILTMCDTLLSETVSYVDEKNTGLDDNRIHLEAMTSAVQTLRMLNGSSEL